MWKLDELHLGLSSYSRPALRHVSSRRHVTTACSAARPHVAIVGAGAAGLATALSLAHRGFAVTLLEQGPVVGGRVRTCQVRSRPYDLGATWLHGRSDQNPARRYAEQLAQLPKEKRGGERAAPRSVLEGQVVDGKLVSRVASAYASALEVCEVHRADDSELWPEDVDSAVAQILRKSELPQADLPAELVEASLQWRRQLECSISGCDAVSDLSLASWGEYQDIPYAVRASNRWEGGFAAVLQEALKDLFRVGDERCDGQVVLHLNCEVQKVIWSKSTAKCCVLGRLGSEEVKIDAQHVVITASLGALKAAELCFEPPLPEAKCRSIERLGFGTVNKVLLLYPYAWWIEIWSNLRFLWRKESDFEPRWLRHVYSCTPCLQGGLEFWLSGAAARAMEAVTDGEVMKALHGLLLRCGGATEVPEPNGLVRSAWSSEPGIRGSYSFVPVGASGHDIDELAKPEGAEMTLSFAGEHTHRTYYSTVHGAWWSGVKVADLLVAHWTRGEPP